MARIVKPPAVDLSSRRLIPARRRSLRVTAWLGAMAVLAATAWWLNSPWQKSERVPTPTDGSLQPRKLPQTPIVSTCFTPAEACEIAIIRAIKEARSQIRVQAYGFTAQNIIFELASAKFIRGIDVEVILDKSNEQIREGARNSGAATIVAAGVPVFIDYKPAIAHNKVIIIDRSIVITGSYNFTQAADRRNAENVTFIDAPEVAAQFLSNWQARQMKSRPYKMPIR